MNVFVKLLFGVVVGLLLSEVLLALFYPQELLGDRMERFPAIYQSSSLLSHELRPGAVVRARIVDGPYDITITSDGVRKTTGRVTNDRRVVLVGDSMVFGHGLDDNETIASFLQEKTGSTVINAGVPGWGVDQEALWIRERSAEFSPDVIYWFVFVGNDIADTARHVKTYENGTLVRVSDPGQYVNEDGRSVHNTSRSVGSWWSVARPVHDWLDAHSHLYVLVKSVVANEFFVGNNDGTVSLLKLTTNEQQQWQTDAESIVRKTIRSSKVPVVLVILPHRLLYTNPIDSLNNSRRKWYFGFMHEKNGVIDAYDALGVSSFFLWDGHLNASGAESVAGLLARNEA